VLDAVPVVRAWPQPGETEQLARTTQSMREAPNVSAKLETALLRACSV
jgi:hypothetical protein